MSNIDKQALIAKIKKQTASFETVVLKEDEANALLDELEHYKSREDRVTKLVLDNSASWEELYKKLEAAEKRIAELSDSHSKLREAMAGIHNTITGGGAYTPLAAILNASKRAYEESAAAAGKGE